MISYILQEPKRVVPVEQPKPVPTGHEVLVHVKNVGICGSDIHLFHGTYSAPHSYPMRFGHEWSGVVEAVGEDVKALKAGDLVKSVSSVCGGKGGGKPDSAMGGGTDLLKVDDALATVDDFVVSKLG